MSDPLDAVPPRIRRLWRLPTGSTRGRRPRMTVDDVVGAALRIADAEGLDGVRLPRVAEALGVTTMSLYPYIGSAAELLDLMADDAGKDVPQVPEGTPWRDGVEHWARCLLDMHSRHTWLCHVPVTQAPAGPNSVGWMEAFLTALAGTGLRLDEQLAMLSLTGSYVRGFAQVQLSMHRAPDMAERQAEYGRALALLVDPARHPHAAPLFTMVAAEMRVEGPGPEFDFGLEVVLDGFAAAVDRSRGASSPKARRPG